MEQKQDDKVQLALLIKEEIEKEFAFVHLSGNLADTIEIRQTAKGIEVEIPARKYDIAKYLKTGEISYYDGDESYASQVDESGGFSGLHYGYIDRCIAQAIRRFAQAKTNDTIVVSGEKL